MSDTKLVPRLVVRDATAAIRFYREAFDAEEVSCYRDGDGKVVHAELAIDGAPFHLKDADAHDPAGSSVILSMSVPDADDVFAAAVAAGAEVVIPLDDQPYGERAGRLRDPFGHQWIVSTVIEDLSPDEIERRMQG